MFDFFSPTFIRVGIKGFDTIYSKPKYPKEDELIIQIRNSFFPLLKQLTQIFRTFTAEKHRNE